MAADLCFLGERADATRLMQAADFLVLPSHFEGLSNALLEAMAAGCPVIASAVGGSPELVEDGRTGLLFPGDDADALASAMIRMARSMRCAPSLHARQGGTWSRTTARPRSVPRRRPCMNAACAAPYPATAREGAGTPRTWRADPMRLFYAIPIVLLPNTAHLPPDVGVGGSVAFLAVALFLRHRDPPHLARSGYLTPPLLALFLAMLVGFIAAHWGDLSNAGQDLREAKVAILYPFLYLAYRRCGLDLKATKQLIGLVLVVAAVAGLEAVLQGLKFNLGEFSEEQRATGPFGQLNMANRAGVFFAMFLPMMVAVALQFRQRKSVRWAAIAGGAILVAAILFTYSRQSYLIALFAVMVLLLWRSGPAALLAAVLLVAVSAFFLPESVVQRVQGTQQVDLDGGVRLDASTTSRFKIWGGTLGMLSDHPGGVGLGRFNEHIGDYTSYPGMDAHNGFILTLAECGPLGLMALLWLFWRLWLLARWLRRSVGHTRPEARTLAWGFTLTVGAMALSNLYGSPFFDSLIMASFWILCGLMERYGVIKAHAANLVAAYSTPRAAAVPLGQRFPLAARALPRLSMFKQMLR